jgi:hypothetical protein
MLRRPGETGHVSSRSLIAHRRAVVKQKRERVRKVEKPWDNRI